jgi:hypothetical protein
MIGLYHSLRFLGKILIVLCGISGSTDVKPVFRKVYLKTKEMTNISQAQTGSKAKSHRDLLWISRLFPARSGVLVETD